MIRPLTIDIEGQPVKVHRNLKYKDKGLWSVLFKVDGKEKDETYLFVSDLGDGLPVEAIQPALEELKITPPKGFLKEVCFDGEVNMGNKCKNWDRRTSARHRRRPLNLLNRPRVTLLLRKSGYAERFFARFTRDNRPDLLIFLWQLAEQYPKLAVAR